MERNKEIATVESSETNPTSTSETGKMMRRSFIAGVATAVVGAVALGQQKRDYEKNAPPIHYPDPDIIVLDKRFDKYKIGNAAIQRLHTGTLWAEGPAWNGVGRFLVWSDVAGNVQHRWLDEDNH